MRAWREDTSTEKSSTATSTYRAAHVPEGQDLGHRWSTRLAHHDDPADRRAIRQITFESSAEADRVEELVASGEGWLPQYSLIPSGEFRHPPAFGAENAQVAGR
ncbi:hypothetical protein [Micrococcus porci]|uniref:hypothetical protein n=1 Tax=Micrococcus porci TaxID=2856555 RepID=UPI003CF60C80